SATPEMFFEYLIGKYGDGFPVHRGNWTTSWDTSGMGEPPTEKIAKNAQDEVLASEKILAGGAELGLGTYRHSPFDNAWDMMLAIDEHSGAGGGFINNNGTGGWSQAKVDENNEQHWDYAVSARDSDLGTRDEARVVLRLATAIAGQD